MTGYVSSMNNTEAQQRDFVGSYQVPPPPRPLPQGAGEMDLAPSYQERGN